MIKSAVIGVAAMSLSLFGMSPEGIEEATSRISGAVSSRNLPVAQPSTDSLSELYVPNNIDVTCCLESNGKCCYITYALCKAGVGLCEIASLVCSGLCVAELKEYTGLARGLALGSAASNAAGLGLTYALFRIESKVRKLDRAVGRARARAENPGV